jgi:hypothetical protein
MRDVGVKLPETKNYQNSYGFMEMSKFYSSEIHDKQIKEI